MTKLNERLKSDVTTGHLRVFGGFKCDLTADIEGLSISIPIRYGKLESEAVKQQTIIHRNIDGEVVTKKRFTDDGKLLAGYTQSYANEDNKKVSKEEVLHYQLKDGKEEQVSPFARTKNWQVLKLLPENEYINFLVDKEYEVWTDPKGITGLYKFAGHLRDSKQIACVYHSFGEFIQYVGLIRPVFINGNFVLTCSMTTSKKVFSHLLDVKQAQENRIAIQPRKTATLVDNLL